jgi:hypothetical protein
LADDSSANDKNSRTATGTEKHSDIGGNPPWERAKIPATYFPASSYFAAYAKNSCLYLRW